MLTTAQKRYVDICIRKIAKNETAEALADHFDVSRSAIDSAFRWGKQHNLFLQDSYEQIQTSKAELNAVLERLERIFKHLCRKPPGMLRAEWKPPATQIAAISKQILDYRTRIMEISGVYKQALELSGKVDNTITIVRADGTEDNS